MDAETGKALLNFGLPGVMLGVIFLLVKMWIASNEKLEAAKLASQEKIELERIRVEDKKADAMVAAFTSLGTKIDAHHTLDIQSHSELSRDIGEIRAILTERSTPAEGVIAGAGHYGRPKTGGRP